MPAGGAVLCGVTALCSIPLIRASGPVIGRRGWGAVMGRHHGQEQGRKLSIRPHRAVRNCWVIVALAAAGALVPLSSAAASSPARLDAAGAPSSASAAAAVANGRIAFSQ